MSLGALKKVVTGTDLLLESYTPLELCVIFTGDIDWNKTNICSNFIILFRIPSYTDPSDFIIKSR